jgi:hypothetical protein
MLNAIPFRVIYKNFVTKLTLKNMERTAKFQAEEQKSGTKAALKTSSVLYTLVPGCGRCFEIKGKIQ